MMCNLRNGIVTFAVALLVSTSVFAQGAKVQSMAMTRAKVEVVEGKNARLSVKCKPENADVSGMTWKSSDPSVAKVDSNGNIVAIKPGTVTITAALGGLFAYCNVSILPSGAGGAAQGAAPAGQKAGARGGAAERTYIVADIDEKPTFQGGDQNCFARWVYQNIEYPEMAMENGISGRVTLQFVVDINGSVVEVKVARGVDRLLDKEAVRVVSKSPSWKPGRLDGKPVRVKFTFPVTFKIHY